MKIKAKKNKKNIEGDKKKTYFVKVNKSLKWWILLEQNKRPPSCSLQ